MVPNISYHEIQIKLQKAIALLPHKQQLVFKMKYFEELKYEEIAAQYKMDVTQVKAAVNVDAVNQEVAYRKTIDFLVENLDITE